MSQRDNLGLLYNHLSLPKPRGEKKTWTWAKQDAREAKRTGRPPKPSAKKKRLSCTGKQCAQNQSFMTKCVRAWRARLRPGISNWPALWRPLSLSTHPQNQDEPCPLSLPQKGLEDSEEGCEVHSEGQSLHRRPKGCPYFALPAQFAEAPLELYHIF